jgi:hypothetical protein
MEAESTSEQLRQSHARTPSRQSHVPMTTTQLMTQSDTSFLETETVDLLEVARQEVMAESRLLKQHRVKSGRKKQER